VKIGTSVYVSLLISTLHLRNQARKTEFPRRGETLPTENTYPALSGGIKLSQDLNTKPVPIAVLLSVTGQRLAVLTDRRLTSFMQDEKEFRLIVQTPGLRESWGRSPESPYSAQLPLDPGPDCLMEGDESLSDHLKRKWSVSFHYE
jgi:hypothetical protein